MHLICEESLSRAVPVPLFPQCAQSDDGRPHVSVTHEPLGTVRVMATGGLMGEVLAAASICKKHDADPRAV